MNHIVGKRLKEGLSRDLKKVYKDICNTYVLKVHEGCESYYNDICRCCDNGGIIDQYRDMSFTILYFYLIRYIKLVRPRFYRDNRREFMYHNFRKYYDKGYVTITYRLPSDMIDEWKKLLKEAKL